MKFKKTLKATTCRIVAVLWLTLFGFITVLRAEPVDVEKAKIVALTQLKKTTGDISLRSASALDLVYEPKSETNQPYFYVFNGNKGFVIVSGDDRAVPILGYSDKGSFDPDNIPPNMKEFLEGYQDEIDFVVKQNADCDVELKSQWQKLESGGILSLRSYTPDTYLIKTQWHQDFPYNVYCPNNTPIGCYGTAMAQIICYWGRDMKLAPSHGFGTNGYMSSSGYVSADFENAVYNYDNMPDFVYLLSSDEQKHDIALLSFHCGVAVNTDYRSGGSAAYPENGVIAFRQNFGYSNACLIGTGYKNGEMNPISYDKWVDTLKREIDNLRPILLCGWTSSNRGHGWICDGYKYDGTGIMFHMNWGWEGGGSDGYFALSSLQPGSYDYARTQKAIINIYPDVVSGCEYSGQIGNISWCISDSVLTISGTGDMPNFDYCEQPWFPYQKSIVNAIVDNGVTSVGKYAFSKCENLKTVELPNTVVSIGYEAFAYSYNLINIEIPEDVTSIGAGAFRDCISITNIEVPNGVTKIEDGTFYGCYNLESTNIPYGVTSIGIRSFAGCTITSIEIPNSVTSIASYAFNYCPFTSIEIPNSVTFIGRNAFSACQLLTSVKMPNNITSIEDYTFFYCSSLTNIEIPNSVTSIGVNAFYHSSFTNLKIPSNITNIESLAFAEINSLDSVDVYWDIPIPVSVNNRVFNRSNKSKITLIVPEGTKALYEVADVWKEFNIIEKSDTESASVVTPYSGETSNEQIYGSKVNASLAKGVLTVDTPNKETIRVYSMIGTLLFSAEKNEGKQTYSIPNLSKEIYVITGSNGWNAKVRNN